MPSLKTKAIIPVDIAGFPCDYERIMELVNEPDIRGMFQPTSSARTIGAYLGYE